MLAAMPNQPVGCFQVWYRIALRHEDIGAITQRFLGMRQHNIEVVADVRMIERLQQADIGTRRGSAVIEALRNDHNAEPPLATQINQRYWRTRCGRPQVFLSIEVGYRLA